MDFSQSHGVVKSLRRTVKASYQWVSQQNCCLFAMTVAFGDIRSGAEQSDFYVFAGVLLDDGARCEPKRIDLRQILL